MNDLWPSSPPLAAAKAGARPSLSVIAPTFREAENVPVLFERLKAALGDIPWEMIVVDDDSPDLTYAAAFAIAARDPRMRCVRRLNRSGLSGAVIEGWMASSADFVAVIDADLQHDERVLPKMYRALADDRAELAIGARIEGNDSERGLSPARQKLSDLGAWFFRRVAGGAVRDPMSGFFAIRREIVERIAPRLSTDGFKILVDVLLTSDRPLKIVEVPYQFRKRAAGESKLTALVGLDFLGLVVHHATGGLLPIRFALFAVIGAFGLIVHLATLYALLASGSADFGRAQLVATLVAMGSNFVLNNEITYRRVRYKGLGLVPGYLAFAAACSVGVLANIDIASWIHQTSRPWWIPGLGGALLSLFWNYSVSTNLIWRPRFRH